MALELEDGISTMEHRTMQAYYLLLEALDVFPSICTSTAIHAELLLLQADLQLALRASGWAEDDTEVEFLYGDVIKICDAVRDQVVYAGACKGLGAAFLQQYNKNDHIKTSEC